MSYLTPSQQEQRPQVHGWQIGAALALLAAIYIVGLVIGGEFRSVMVAGLEPLPFMLLALLAYLGIERTWARVLALLLLALLVGGMALLVFGASAATLFGVPGRALSPARLGSSDTLRLIAIFIGICVAVIIGILGFIPGVRRWLSRRLPIDPDSFVHTVALVAIVAIMLTCFVPLLFLEAPPLLALVQQSTAAGDDITAGRGDAGMLRDTLYGLLWLVPSAVVAVGYGVRRDLRTALERLGLVRPTWRQVAAAIGLALALVVGVTLLSMAIDWLWGTLGWPKTDQESFGKLLAFAMSPLGALVVGVTAGLGEELAVRGVLQPRLGILLSNLFFTALHALQYHWDALLVVFVVGTVLGLVRRRTNTTTSAIVHGVYDFLLIMAAVLQIPWFS
jgi:membrane protease YdiL (CAAX protease family)